MTEQECGSRALPAWSSWSPGKQALNVSERAARTRCCGSKSFSPSDPPVPVCTIESLTAAQLISGHDDQEVSEKALPILNTFKMQGKRGLAILVLTGMYFVWDHRRYVQIQG